jgi:hypothetical protein
VRQILGVFVIASALARGNLKGWKSQCQYELSDSLMEFFATRPGEIANQIHCPSA